MRPPSAAESVASAMRALPVDARRRRPPLRAGLVPRDRLVRPLLASADVPLALLIAPAGYGKTTLLSQWAERDRRPFAWLTLDDSDNEPGTLFTSIAAVLGAIEPIDDELPRALAGIRRSFVLVLDDVHLLRTAKSIEALAAIVEHLPWGSQLALASRDEPAMPVGRLRANRNVVELRFSDLMMTPSEGGVLLGSAGVGLPGDDMEALVRRTEGWAAGLYLAALSLRGRMDPVSAAASFRGDNRAVADYIRDEVLSGLSRDRLRFLTRCAVLDRLSGPLCDVLLERSGSGRMLADLERANVLLFPDEEGSYRCHTLLRQMLEAELRRGDPELETTLHRRAAGWHADHGEVDRAITHAIAARDPELTGRLLWPNFLRYASYGRNYSIEGWLAHFAEDEIGAHPALALVAAGSELARADRYLVERWTFAAALGLEAATTSNAPFLAGGISILQAAVATEGIARTAELAARAHQTLAEDDPWRSLSCLLIGATRHLSGERDTARRVLEEGVRRGAVGAPSIQALCLSQLALLALDEGDWADASAHATRARDQIERFGVIEYPMSALVFAVTALVNAQGGRVDQAKIDAGRATELVGQLVDAAPWYEIEVRIALALAALRLSNMAGARSQLTEASRLVRRSPDAVVLGEWLEEAWTRADSQIGHSVGDRWSLTTAELRVLQFLPTHLSLPEIAKRLNVSANTVKTHTRAIYRKLDASSRAEAVARARRTGLIDLDRYRLAEAA